MPESRLLSRAAATLLRVLKCVCANNRGGGQGYLLPPVGLKFCEHTSNTGWGQGYWLAPVGLKLLRLNTRRASNSRSLEQVG